MQLASSPRSGIALGLKATSTRKIAASFRRVVRTDLSQGSYFSLTALTQGHWGGTLLAAVASKGEIAGRELARDSGGQARLWARPHMLRHSFALRWYTIATFVGWQRTSGLSPDEQRDLRHQLGDVWFLLASLLGHRSAETTRNTYLEPFQSLQVEQLMALMDSDDRAALERLVDTVADGEPRVLTVASA